MSKMKCELCHEVRIGGLGSITLVCPASDRESDGHQFKDYTGDVPACECPEFSGKHDRNCAFLRHHEKIAGNYGRLPEGVKPSQEEVERRATAFQQAKYLSQEWYREHITREHGTKLHAGRSIREMQAIIHSQNKDMGWWDTPREAGTLLMLVTSEIAEAMEGFRKDLMDDHLPHRKMAEVELADAMIRIMDMAEFYGFDLAGAIVEKVAYNRTRADHQPGARAEAHGKKF